MKRNIKRLPALLLAIILCLSLLPGTAWAANFPTKFYASVNYDYSSYSKSKIFGTVTQSSSGTLTYNEFGEKTDRVVYGMEYAGGVFYTVEGNKLPRNADDGFRELRMYNSSLTSYRTIGTVNKEDGGYWIVDTAMDLSGEEPALYGTYNTVIPDVIAMTMICTIDLETAEPGNYLQVTGLPSMHIIYAIAFNKDGTLYAIGADGRADGGPATLYTLDLKNASSGKVSATPVGEIKDSSDKKISTNWIQDLGFDHDKDTLYWAENDDNVLYTLNTESAEATSVGKLPTLQSFCIPYDAAFAGNKHMISVICEGAGTVTSNNASSPFYMVEDNGSITLNITPDAGSGLRYVKVNGRSISTAGLTESGYTFTNVTDNHVIEVGFKLAIPAEQHDMTWFHYQGEPASFYTQHHVYKFYDLPDRFEPDFDAPTTGYVQTLLDEGNNPINNDEIILPGNYDVHVIHPGNETYAALDVTYKHALQLGKCPGTPGRPVVYGKVGCKQGDLTTTSALQDYYRTNGELIDAAHDEIPVTLVWLDPEKEYTETGYFLADHPIIYAAQELDQRLKNCYNLNDKGTPLTEGCQISSRATQVVVLPADEASLIKVQASDDAGGTVSGKGVYKNDDQVTVTATANADAGYEFKGWQENGQIISGADATYTFEAGGDRTLTALFEVDEDYRVTLKTDPTDAGTVEGGGSYETDPHSATVTATAKPGYYFMGWYKDGETSPVETNAEYTFTVGQEGITLTAKFGVDLLARAELAKKNLESALGTTAFEWLTLTQAVDAYEKAEEFVKAPPSVIQNAETRFNDLTEYYSGIEELDLSGQGIDNGDFAELYLFTGVTDLNLSGNKGITSLTNLPNSIQPKTLNLSSTGIADLNSLTTLTNLENLNLSNNKGIVSLTGLSSLTNLETLDISGTGVTTLESLIKEGESRFPGYQNLTAHNLTLTSLSALAGTVNVKGFSAEAITEWDFTKSTLPDTEDSKADVATIQDKLDDNKFIPPTIKTTPTPIPGGGGGGATSYGVTVADCEHGKISATPAKAAKGDTVTVTVTPDEGYEARSVSVTGAGGEAVEVSRNDDGTFSFVMPAGDVTVHASFADAWENPFTDLSEDHWGYGAVRTANLLGLMKGIGGTTLFAPDDGLMREQAATVMWNLMGAGDVSRPEAPQADVDQSQWYAPYVNWAVDSKVMDGYDDGAFGVGDSLTREQFAAVVAKAVGADVDSADQAALGAFPDADGVSGWARATMAWAVEAGVLNGVEAEDGSRELQATRELTRAEMAAMMVNAIEVGVLDFGA